MKKYGSMSPILRRLKEKGPNKYCLVKTRTITKQDIEDYPARWGIIKDWYEQLEEDQDCDSISMIIQSIVNSAVYQERIYFALTRDTVVSLFKNDNNWKQKKPGLTNASYKDLLNTMVDSGWFEQHPENERFFKQKKPRIFKVVSEEILDLMKPVPAEEQLRQVLDFVENNPENETPDEVSDEVSDVVLVLVEGEGEEKEKNSLPNHEISKPTMEFMDLLAKDWSEKAPNGSDLPKLISDAIKNCIDFEESNINTLARDFERFLKGFGNSEKSKDIIKDKVEKFKIKAEIALRKNKHKDTETIPSSSLSSATSSVKTTVTMDEEAENYTLKVLNNSFGKENIKVLKRQLEHTKDEQQKLEIKAEIEFWESVV